MDTSKLFARSFSLAFVTLAATLALMLIFSSAEPLYAG